MITYTVKVDDYKNRWWCVNDKLHREDGPAVEYADGTKHWYLKGKFHREDGPAVECANGSKYWYLNGDRLTQAEFNSKIKKTIVIDGVTYKLVKE
jgi:hypothetical protein